MDIQNLISNKEKFIETILNRFPDLIFIYDLTQKRNVYLNETFPKLLGYTHQEIEEMGSEFLEKLLIPEENEKIEKTIYEKLNKIRKGEFVQFERKAKHKNGEIKTFQGYYKIFSTNEEGSPKEIIVIAHDISTQKKVENIFDLSIDNLSMNAIKLYYIIEKMGEGLLLSNHKGNIDVYNPKMEKMTGYTQEESKSVRRLLKFIYPEKNELKVILKKISTLKREGDTIEFDTAIRTKNGERKYLLVTTTMLNFKGKFCFLGICRDITRKVRNELALQNAINREREANQLKSAFIANVSHEFRTPINGILGFVNLLKKGDLDTYNLMDGLQKIENSSIKLLKLVEDVLYLSKIESKEIQRVDSPFYLENVLKDIVYIAGSKINSDNIKFETDFAFPLPKRLIGDEKKITFILLHLLDNAIKFTKEGKITFKVKFEGNNLLFSVIDTGIGIEGGQIFKIFQPFYQLSNPLNKTEGSGIGLTICYKLLELMNTKLQINSKFGKGSEFYFFLDLPRFDNQNIDQAFDIQDTKNNFKRKDLVDNSLFELFNQLPKVLKKELYNTTINGDVEGTKKVLYKINSLDKKFNLLVGTIMNLIDSFKLKEVHDYVTKGIRL